MSEYAFENSQQAADLMFRLYVHVARAHEQCSCDMAEGVKNHSAGCAKILVALRAYGEWETEAWKVLPDDDSHSG